MQEHVTQRGTVHHILEGVTLSLHLFLSSSSCLSIRHHFILVSASCSVPAAAPARPSCATEATVTSRGCTQKEEGWDNDHLSGEPGSKNCGRCSVLRSLTFNFRPSLSSFAGTRQHLMGWGNENQFPKCNHAHLTAEAHLQLILVRCPLNHTLLYLQADFSEDRATSYWWMKTMRCF
ncbi:unnamed protein product [Pleuronectes platessa]|uniref:Uncharacterized protein n=1 Tax=Pleuronectes platessa TaxID=8262 RepID=A0A9N7THS7_PLEPL|nr:unnamed protein product [Pleuronectes platessa]